LLETTAVNKLSQKEYVKNASVKLYENNIYIEDMALIDSTYKRNGLTFTTYYYSSEKTVAKAGKIYHIEVNTPDQKLITGETYIPEPIAILAVDTIFNYKILSEENTIDKNEKFRIHFKDPMGVNFYRITIKKKYGLNKGNNTVKIDEKHGIIAFNEIDTVFSYYNEDKENEFFNSANNSFLIFNDKKIEGQEYVLELSQSTTETYYGTKKGEFTQYIIELHSLTSEGYNYLKTVDLQSQGSTNQEPVISYTNITNGVGIFTGYSASQKIITLGEYPIDGFIYK